MGSGNRIEAALEVALARAESRSGPPLLAQALRHAVFPGGQRIRPRLCLSVAMACGDDMPVVTDAAAAAIELLHCASLVHDDLPTFDNADTRRGKPTIHKAFNEPLAVLAGDALIVMAFQTLAKSVAAAPDRLAPLVEIYSEAVGAPNGICAGQAWESEPTIDLVEYQRAKTGALFAAATEAGAAAAGHPHQAWRVLGEALGEAYQIADDLRDVAADPEQLGKPVGQDATLGRPNAVQALGLKGAVGRLKRLVSAAVESIPECPGRAPLQAAILEETGHFLPKELAQQAA
ncbi:polyprenyl synthetase family protein [Roseospira goensis]|uniref:Geranylgeranyl diphosphate synthase type II n=1 Tax=Roseospira goensis TaxID=391922 RepID=A0A7W6RY83_9PROT|nr:polyprenyl synthetase family protein [Roseospira goensis]MBB4285441.1 geranylgeranyl diphosphate synthase type II [Roseospira goensis]